MNKDHHSSPFSPTGKHIHISGAAAKGRCRLMRHLIQQLSRKPDTGVVVIDPGDHQERRH